jgi:hypothetical protein
MTKNPMFLGLLCQHMQLGYPFPDNSHSVFEKYIEARLDRDKDRLISALVLHHSNCGLLLNA